MDLPVGLGTGRDISSEKAIRPVNPRIGMEWLNRTVESDFFWNFNDLFNQIGQSGWTGQTDLTGKLLTLFDHWSGSENFGYLYLYICCRVAGFQYCISPVWDYHETTIYRVIWLPISVQDLIRRCLTYNQAERPDVLTIAQDPYLTYSKK